MKATTLLSELMEKAGIDTSDAKLKDILAVQVDIPDEFAKELSEKLMTLDAAKPLLKNGIISDFSKGFLKNIDERLQAEGIEKSEIDSVFNENGKPKSTGKVILSAMEKIAEAKEKVNPANPDKEKLQKEEIVKLNKQLSEMKEGYVPKADIDKVRADWDGDKYERAIESHFLPKKWSDNYPVEVRPTLVKTFLEKELAAMGAKAVMNGKDVKIVKADDLTSDYFDSSNKLVTFASLADKIMSANKFLAVSTETSSTSTTVVANSGSESNLPKKLTAAQKALNDSIKDQMN